MYIFGIDPTKTSTTAEFDVGQIGFNTSSDGAKGYMYVQANGAITGDGYVCDIDVSSFDAAMSTTTTTAPGTGQGKPVGIARVAFADNDYGWVQIYGVGVVRVAASCAAYTALNSTATAGQIDDDATAGAEVIEGVILDAANGGSAGTVAGFINWPRVGRTL
ncbi:hypothetical protein [Massilia endophytica]|uniref:hypothetical protein n=1 Tax=Massilia endophytica TaxID=2899220 RepID=UPI001E3E76D5|nr:hypothetical protein [Massilia endophytica]UGQ44969.1 hypothetical protein LSQ66_14300 [Massilia endophytica]